MYGDDIARGFALRMTAVDAILLAMETRGHVFFDDTLRLGRMVDLLNRPCIQKEFETRVIGDAPRLAVMPRGRYKGRSQTRAS